MAYGRHSHGNGRQSGRSRWPMLGFGLGGGAVAAAIVAAAVGLTQVSGSPACASVITARGVTSGTATHYVLEPGEGNCSFPFPPGAGLFVALSPSEYDNAAPCGSYLEVSGPDGSVRVEVADQCPPCAPGHIDLSEAAFAKIAPLAAGLVNVTYQTITDPSLPGPVELRVKEGSSQWWLALLVMNAGNPVASVAVENAQGAWTDLSRASYNYWVAASGAGQGPFTVRVTDTLGHQVTVRAIALEPGVVQDTGTWMYGAGSAPPTAAPSATPTTTASTSATPTATPSGSPSPRASTTARRHRPTAKPGPVPASQAAARASGIGATLARVPRTAVPSATC
jgi:expansin